MTTEETAALIARLAACEPKIVEMGGPRMPEWIDIGSCLIYDTRGIKYDPQWAANPPAHSPPAVLSCLFDWAMDITEWLARDEIGIGRIEASTPLDRKRGDWSWSIFVSMDNHRVDRHGYSPTKYHAAAAMLEAICEGGK